MTEQDKLDKKLFNAHSTYIRKKLGRKVSANWGWYTDENSITTKIYCNKIQFICSERNQLTGEIKHYIQ